LIAAASRLTRAVVDVPAPLSPVLPRTGPRGISFPQFSTAFAPLRIQSSMRGWQRSCGVNLTRIGVGWASAHEPKASRIGNALKPGLIGRAPRDAFAIVNRLWSDVRGTSNSSPQGRAGAHELKGVGLCSRA